MNEVENRQMLPCACACLPLPSTVSLLSNVQSLGQSPPSDLSKWSPDYVRSIAGTAEFDTIAEACSKVTPTLITRGS